MQTPPVVSRAEWDAARAALLAKEKALTRAKDALAAERRRMPWMEVRKSYRFLGPEGDVSLWDLFEGRRQLIVYRAFMDPGVSRWPDQGCVGCSLMADHIPNLAHLRARGTSFVYVSRGPQADLTRIKAKMGWSHIPWYTLTDDFDADFDVAEWHGHNAFVRDGDRIFRTYFINERGDEQFVPTWSWLDMTAFGRQEIWESSPDGYPQDAPYRWWNYNDAY
ncbi:DUF899 domain-containing protein [Amorphus sp. 3PC139-8]|uniref:DUF899 domain-containing protein n=1 Tax=Amorphus sp. 3PC139-8 TaxID=2735676 RepID=UPI00345CE986